MNASSGMGMAGGGVAGAGGLGMDNSTVASGTNRRGMGMGMGSGMGGGMGGGMGMIGNHVMLHGGGGMHDQSSSFNMPGGGGGGFGGMSMGGGMDMGQVGRGRKTRGHINKDGMGDLGDMDFGGDGVFRGGLGRGSAGGRGRNRKR